MCHIRDVRHSGGWLVFSYIHFCRNYMEFFYYIIFAHVELLHLANFAIVMVVSNEDQWSFIGTALIEYIQRSKDNVLKTYTHKAG